MGKTSCLICLWKTPNGRFFDPFITSIRGHGKRLARNHRRVLDRIFWIARTGSQWQNLPEEFGKWSSVQAQSP
ncbi:MAG: hypothetical protein C0605_09150 [Hyphomicrobiales bacterium]|nr:MAG: hypothetical protein C0605_09150 [Hyphomicrobiales bacterium]